MRFSELPGKRPERPGKETGRNPARSRIRAHRRRYIGATMPDSHASRRILFVEDEEAISEPFSKALRRNGFEPVVARTAAEALESAERVEPDLVLLDLNLPDGDGRDVCRTLRKDSDVPIVMLTARGTEMDRVLGLELGADDYVVKPFSSREVISRIRAVLRRPRADPGRAGRADRGRRARARSRRTDRASSPASELTLTRKEFDLLAELMRARGQVVTREDLMSRVWDVNWFGSTKTLDVHIGTLRRKLGDDSANPRFIETVRGVGLPPVAPEAGLRKPPAPTHARGGLRAAAGADRLRRAAGRQPPRPGRLRGQGAGARARPTWSPPARRSCSSTRRARDAAAPGRRLSGEPARPGDRRRRARAGDRRQRRARPRSGPATPRGPRSPPRSAARPSRRPAHSQTLGTEILATAVPILTERPDRSAPSGSPRASPPSQRHAARRSSAWPCSAAWSSLLGVIAGALIAQRDRAPDPPARGGRAPGRRRRSDGDAPRSREAPSSARWRARSTR